MPGQTHIIGKPELPFQEEGPTGRLIGRLVEGVEFQQFADAGLVRPVGSFVDQERGQEYALFVVAGVGFAYGNLASKRVYLVGTKPVLDIARVAGLDEEPSIIVLPNGEVARG
jgi:hypothetical protein